MLANLPTLSLVIPSLSDYCPAPLRPLNMSYSITLLTQYINNSKSSLYQ